MLLLKAAFHDDVGERNVCSMKYEERNGKGGVRYQPLTAPPRNDELNVHFTLTIPGMCAIVRRCHAANFDDGLKNKVNDYFHVKSSVRGNL